MRATATKNRAAARKNVRRRPSTKAIAKIEKTLAELSDLPVPAPVDGQVGDVFFDGANTFYGSRCQADDGDRTSTVYVEIEIHPQEPEVWDNATVFFQFFRDASRDKTDLQLRCAELEPLAVALSRAVANARARGFLPPPRTGAAT